MQPLQSTFRPEAILGEFTTIIHKGLKCQLPVLYCIDPCLRLLQIIEKLKRAWSGPEPLPFSSRHQVGFLQFYVTLLIYWFSLHTYSSSTKALFTQGLFVLAHADKLLHYCRRVQGWTLMIHLKKLLEWGERSANVAEFVQIFYKETACINLPYKSHCIFFSIVIIFWVNWCYSIMLILLLWIVSRSFTIVIK